MALPNKENLTDIWTYLSQVKKPIVLYGMGDGADKVLSVLDEKGVQVSGFFASDDFVRGQIFHGQEVQKLSSLTEKHGDDLIILIAFASALPEIIERIEKLNEKYELYIPDVPVFGDAVFNLEFYLQHYDELQTAREMLADEYSKKLFDAIVRFRLFGKLEDLEAFVSTPEEVRNELLNVSRYEHVVDMGAYIGDSLQDWVNMGFPIKLAYAFEPDPHSFKKLSAYANEHLDFGITPLNCAAWNQESILRFDANPRGNRNACAMDNYNHVVLPRKTKVREVAAKPLDAVTNERIDWIKMDVEGSEKQALEGAESLISRDTPDMLISLYHRSEDLFALILQIQKMNSKYKFHIRRFPYIPAWDLNLYCMKA